MESVMNKNFSNKIKKCFSAYDLKSIESKMLANGNGIYILFHDHLSMDAWFVYVVDNGKFVKFPNKQDVKIKGKAYYVYTPKGWTSSPQDYYLLADGLNSIEYYGSLGLLETIKLLKSQYPDLKVFHCDVGYYTFKEQWKLVDDLDLWKSKINFDEVLKVS